MGLTFKQTGGPLSRASAIMDAPKTRSRMRGLALKSAFQRLTSSAFALSLLSFIIYCSSLYFGAFADIGEFTGASQAERAQKTISTVNRMPRVKHKTFISPIAEYLALDRVYMRRGQSILASYSVPKNSQLNLSIKQCKTIPIFEIFNCKVVSEQDKLIRNKATGYVEFTAIRPGFYHFENAVLQAPNKALKENFDYRVVWQRGGKPAL